MAARVFVAELSGLGVEVGLKWCGREQHPRGSGKLMHACSVAPLSGRYHHPARAQRRPKSWRIVSGRAFTIAC